MMESLTVLLKYEATIHIVSAIVSLLLGLVTFSLRRNATTLREKKWTGPFAWTFVVIAVAYLFRFANWMITGDDQNIYLRVLLALCSGGTNFLFFLAALRLVDVEPFFVKFPSLEGWVLRFQKRLIGKSAARIVLFLVLFAVALIRVTGGWEGRVPGDIFSALALSVMGFVLYQNISLGRDKLMAWFALLSSICYALLYLAATVTQYYIEHDAIEHNWIPKMLVDASTTNNILKFGIALPLKCFLFFAGYSLMLRISGPVEGIERLLDSATRREREFFENDGIVKSIHRELQVKKVRLYIRLPGLKENQLALYFYPASDGGNKRGPQFLDYTKGTDYDRVMNSGEPYIKYHEKNLHRLLPLLSNVTVPLFFHNSVIACLEAEIGDEKFTVADQDNLLRIATLISPAVQAYREVSALNKISEDLARLQIKVVSYDMETYIQEIVEVVQNVISPLAIGVSIEAGFSQYRGTYPLQGELARLINDKLDAEIGEIFVADDSGDYLLVKRELRISPVDSKGQVVGEQFIGKFVFAADKVAMRREQPTLATNFLYHSTVSVLITDTLLDFIRGYLNQLTDQLGVQLSGLEETKPEEWLGKVETIAKKAGLLWAVASYSGNDEPLGNNEMVALAHKLNQKEHEEKWKRKDDGTWLYSLDQTEVGDDQVIHIIKKEVRIKETELTLWFGVSRPEFGLELSYTSPWKFFIDHFCEIANSALHRILITKEQEERKKQIVEFQGLATAAVTTGTVIHQLVNHVRNLTHPLTALEFAPREGRFDAQKQFISYIRQASDQIDDLVKLFSGVVKPDERRPCSLDEVVKHALELLKDSLMRYAITIENRVQRGSMLDVPFHVAATALVNIVNNAKDAIRDGHIRNGLIQISMEEKENQFICHITDNGLGVPQAVLKTLFTGVSKSDKPYSHGIGLYLSAHSLRENGGDIVLTRPGPEPSTTFSICFPKVRSA